MTLSESERGNKISLHGKITKKTPKPDVNLAEKKGQTGLRLHKITDQRAHLHDREKQPAAADPSGHFVNERRWRSRRMNS